MSVFVLDFCYFRNGCRSFNAVFVYYAYFIAEPVINAENVNINVKNFPTEICCFAGVAEFLVALLL